MTTKLAEWPLLVYLDQKGWIDLAKIEYRSVKTYEETRLLETIYHAVEKDKALFPLSIVHLDELPSRKTWRQQLAALMVKLSKGYSLQPYVDHQIAIEIDQIVAEKLGYPRIDLRQVFLKPGIHHLIGSKVEIVSRNGEKNKKPPEEIKEKMTNLLYDPKVFEFSLTQTKPDPSLGRYQKQAAAQMDEIRKGLLKIKDKDLRRRTFLAQNVSAIVLPHVFEILVNRGLPRDFLKMEKWTREDMDRFLTQVPTGLTFITLMMYRDLQFQKAIEVNDIADVWGLTLAIPYCDVVVTEGRWVSIVRQSKLNTIRNTTMLSSINDLMCILAS
jgi:hypothetical protein